MITSRRSENGQTLVLMVLALVGLLAAVGLGIDGGMALLERRRMQNAADAAALAGTRELMEHMCDDPPNEAAIDAAIQSEVHKYAGDNGVEDPPNNVVAEYVEYDDTLEEITVAGPVGVGQIPTGSAGISVTVDIRRPTAFLNLVGQDTAAASAHATGLTGPASLPPLIDSSMLPNDGGVGLLPIGVHDDTLVGLGEGDTLCVIDSESWKNKDQDGDGIIDDAVHAFPSANRGWIMLSCVFNDGVHPGGGIGPRTPDCSASNSRIKAWIDQSDPFDGTTIYPGAVGSYHGDWIVGDPGTRASSFHELDQLGQTHPDETFYIPVFDMLWLGHKMEDEFTEPGNLFKHNDFWYHIIGFIGVEVGQSSPSCGSGEITVTLTQSIFATTAPDFEEDWGWQQGDPCQITELTVTLWE